jgi:hypothetical protein
MPTNARKKLRGQRRRFKALERWCQQSMTLNVERLIEHSAEYQRLPNALWQPTRWTRGNYVTTPNPRWQRRVLELLVKIHNTWKEQLETLGEPYYLAIWITLPDFRDSQVVTSVRGRLHYYDALLAQGKNKPLPAYFNFQDLNWSHGHDLYDLRDSDAQYVVGFEALKQQAVETSLFDGEIIYWIHGNDVWFVANSPRN